jgi:hypothetical protein
MTAPPLSGRNWGTAKVLKNLYWESKIPSTLAAGNYLIRHELLALHQAKTPQFYAECAQVRSYVYTIWILSILICLACGDRKRFCTARQ